MPGWTAVVIGGAAFLTAVYVIFAKLILPLAKGLTIGEKVMPMLEEMAYEFRGVKTPFLRLRKILERDDDPE